MQRKENNKKWISLGIVLILMLVTLQPVVIEVMGDNTPIPSNESDIRRGDPCDPEPTGDHLDLHRLKESLGGATSPAAPPTALLERRFQCCTPY